MADQTIQELVEAKYGKGELADAVLADIKERGTADKIVGGQATLPHPQDAARWLDRKKNVQHKADDASAIERHLSALEQRVTALESQGNKPQTQGQ